MSVRFYFDAHVSRAVAIGLRMNGLDVLTAQDDHADSLEDEKLLERANAMGRVLVSQDSDFLRIAAEWQSIGKRFGGIIYGHQLRVSIGEMIRDLLILASSSEAEDWANRLEFLPLR